MRIGWRPLTFRLLAAALIAAVAVDVAHDLLNARYQPFSGPLDDAMHLVFVPSVVLLGVFEFALSSVIVDRVRGPGRALGVVPFFALLGLEVVSMRLRWRDVGASSYWPLFPDFLGGLLVGIACVYVARPLLELRRVRWVVTVLVFAYTFGAATCDLIWHVERGSRGTSWLWQAPVVDLFIRANIFSFLFLGYPFEPWHGLRPALLGALALAAAAFVLTLPVGRRPIGVALVSSVALLSELLGGWSNFIAD